METSDMLAIIGVSVSVANLAILLLGGLIFIIRMEGKMNVQSVHITSLQKTAETFATVLTNNAVQDQKILQLENTIEGLKRGEGYVRVRKLVDGEYSS